MPKPRQPKATPKRAAKKPARKAPPVTRPVEKYDPPAAYEFTTAEASVDEPRMMILTEEIGYEGGGSPVAAPTPTPRSVQQAIRAITGREIRSVLQSQRRATDALTTPEVVVRTEEVVEPAPVPAKPVVLDILDRVYQVVQVDGREEVRRVSTPAVLSGPVAGAELPPLSTWLADSAERARSLIEPLVESLEPLKEDVDDEEVESARLAVLSLVRSLADALQRPHPVSAYVNRIFRTLLDRRGEDFGRCALADLRLALGLTRDRAINDDEDAHLVNYATVKLELQRLGESWRRFSSDRGLYISTGKAELRRAVTRAEDACVVFEAVLSDRGLGPEVWDDIEWGGPAEDALDRIFIRDGLDVIHTELALTHERLSLNAKSLRRVVAPSLRLAANIAEGRIQSPLASSWHIRKAQETLIAWIADARRIALEMGGDAPLADSGAPIAAPARPSTMKLLIGGRPVYIALGADGRPLVDDTGAALMVHDVEDGHDDADDEFDDDEFDHEKDRPGEDHPEDDDHPEEDQPDDDGPEGPDPAEPADDDAPVEDEENPDQ